MRAWLAAYRVRRLGGYCVVNCAGLETTMLSAARTRRCALRLWGAILLVVASVVVAGCGSGGGTATGRLFVGPPRALYDTPIAIGVSGLDAGQMVTLRMSTRDKTGRTWSSSATFRADSTGRVTGSSEPASGSDGGADPQGLYDSLKPAGGGQAEFTPPHPWTIQVSLLDGGSGSRVVATRTVVRQTPLEDHLVTVRDLLPDDGGLYGELFEPVHPRRGATSVLTFGGSEGGLYYAAQTAAALAAAGHPSLALAYFNAPGLPKHLDQIPVEYFGAALHRLDRAAHVDPHRVAVWGVSRGSEAAQLTAVHYPSLVAGVVAMVPSNVSYPSLPDGADAAWTFDNKPVPTSHEFDNPAPTDDPDAVIPIAHFPGPVFMACGDLDKVWTSCAFARAIQQALGTRATAQTYDTGHLVGLVPAYPSTLTSLNRAGYTLVFGGSPSATAKARGQEWPQILRFLNNLPRR